MSRGALWSRCTRGVVTFCGGAECGKGREGS